jgi:hypothetical protein
MTNIDRAIRDALSKEDAEFLARFENDNPISEALGTFTGRWGAMNLLAALMSFAVFGVFAYCAWNAFNASDVRVTVMWSAGAIWASLAVAMLKIYFFMEMNKNVVLREVKRLELQIARAAARV